MAQPTAYQRVTTSTDYDASAGVMALVFDGVDDSLYSAASIAFNSLPADGQTKWNLLSASEAFDDAVWQKTNTTVTANATTAPDGTTTADKLVATAVSGLHFVRQDRTVTAGPHTASARFKAGEYAAAWISVDGSSNFSEFNLTGAGTATTTFGSCSIVKEGDFYTCTMTQTLSAGSAPCFWGVSSVYGTRSFTGDGTSGIHIWGAQLEAGSTATAYQKTGTDKMTVFAGVHKASDAAIGIAVETSANALGGNAGAFLIAAPWTAGTYRVGSGGSAPTAVETATTYTAPTTSVLAMTANIPADQLALRVNGVQVAAPGFDQGTGNYGNYPLYVGRRNNSANPFNGRIYQLAIKGKAMTAAEIATVESYINSKTKAY